MKRTLCNTMSITLIDLITMKIKNYLLLIFCLLIVLEVKSQGPPILGDKPIMLAKGNIVLKTLSQYRIDKDKTVLYSPFIIHYIASKNILIGAHLPMFGLESQEQSMQGVALADIQLLAKYQFYRKDEMGKTLRMVFKTVQTLGTGKSYNLEDISTSRYQSYFALVSGKETLNYGISNELGWHIDPGLDFNRLRYKLGFGLPLKKQVYPVNQLNLYFEYQNDWYYDSGAFNMLYAQGIQYAKNRTTIEAAIQWPLLQLEVDEEQKRIASFFVGARFII